MKTTKEKIHKETRKNKIVAIILILLGVLSVKIDGNATFALICVVLAISLFFTKKNWIK